MLVNGLVILGAAALIGLIIWWFFGNFQKSSQQADLANGRQEGQVVVKGGYEPEVLYLKQGVPAEVTFKMEDKTACLSHVVFSSLGVDKDLSKEKLAKVQIPTDKAGEIDYACGMDMFHGKIVVR
ncbi:cupredoxin domain-containing protein [Lactobacillus delbrueckii subsp. allosunkii]|uniref:Cupredoxin domain-containing protein n=1 Tax=Lactobacillus delbrueckii subsp. allosunkii TaxID=1050107 RepID=A0ABD4S9W5_9LACO|nr:cupredoxin domain-containing protein [Lactobacillus delbrueckii]MCD5517083.1 cupredoxin domain-containing protein [Lactobacillus delbrueckii subsp. sunkii]MCT3476606.1 cupredoxin domain-containing protein [Lactobacillus delbrueckii subsp. lactis]MCZ0777276.1 cupredoxin domain-containing protein [Lactobacillus delbrueckii subsp. sunkii]MCZ0787406.1 cupredoxin domain-containing protein [Lactobacillus delbrueckii subsp. sunkii]MCZ0794526.1 cupredoxin domain-containing protein [Lactobacillus de